MAWMIEKKRIKKAVLNDNDDTIDLSSVSSIVDAIMYNEEGDNEPGPKSYHQVGRYLQQCSYRPRDDAPPTEPQTTLLCCQGKYSNQ
jgi:hypothetical protein